MRHREYRPKLPRSAVLLLVLILMVAGARAQSDTGGSVAGQISGISGIYFRALVTLRNTATGVELESLSDMGGHFRFAEVEPGIYSVRINAPGVAPWRATNITVEMGQTTFLAPRMTVAFIDHRRHTKSYTPQTNLTPAVSSSLDESFLDNLPSAGGHWSAYAALASAAPDPSGESALSFRGVSPLMNGITLDGVDNTVAF